MDAAQILSSVLQFLWPGPIAPILAGAALIIAGLIGPLKGSALAKDGKTNHDYLIKRVKSGDPAAQFEWAMRLLNNGSTHAVLKSSLDWIKKAGEVLGEPAKRKYLDKYIGHLCEETLPAGHNPFPFFDYLIPDRAKEAVEVVGRIAPKFYTHQVAAKNRKSSQSHSKHARGAFPIKPWGGAEALGITSKAIATMTDFAPVIIGKISLPSDSTASRKDANYSYPLLLKAAQSGDQLAMSNIGPAHLFGIGAPQDFEAAAFWLKKELPFHPPWVNYYAWTLSKLRPDLISPESGQARLRSSATQGYNMAVEQLAMRENLDIGDMTYFLRGLADKNPTSQYVAAMLIKRGMIEGDKKLLKSYLLQSAYARFTPAVLELLRLAHEPDGLINGVNIDVCSHLRNICDQTFGPLISPGFAYVTYPVLHPKAKKDPIEMFEIHYLHVMMIKDVPYDEFKKRCMILPEGLHEYDLEGCFTESEMNSLFAALSDNENRPPFNNPLFSKVETLRPLFELIWDELPKAPDALSTRSEPVETGSGDPTGIETGDWAEINLEEAKPKTTKRMEHLLAEAKLAETQPAEAKVTEAMLAEAMLAETQLAEAMEALVRNAEAGDAKSQYQLAMACEIGSGIPQNHDEYLRWMKRAAENGLIEAVNTLLLENGDFSKERL